MSMQVLLALFSFIALAISNECCLTQLTPEEAYESSEVVFFANVLDGRISEVVGTSTLLLSVESVYKATKAQGTLLEAGNVHAKLNCPILPVEVGEGGVFFGSLAVSGGVVAVNLSCNPSRDYSTCEKNQFRSGIFSKSCGDESSSTPSYPGDDSDDNDEPSGECSCEHGTSDSYTTGPFNCKVCSCSTEYVGKQLACVSRCKVSSSCVLAPSLIGTAVIVVIFVCIMVILRRRRRAIEADEVEMANVSDSEVNSSPYAYQPVMATSHVPYHAGQQVMMTTAQGPVVLNTQPMYMMTQTGEPVVVQVAYI
eukprot:TRINITY_DN16128_c0_g1_i1.p1 TRINITY_DN16128_c0_g1~~TRINITY_DN16128_c0_g1_i1.p1  ORF type:complete len:310 (+),score=48.15 TRINITY_DN16128_c0_g1_i1:37-966(+)